MLADSHVNNNKKKKGRECGKNCLDLKMFGSRYGTIYKWEFSMDLDTYKQHLKSQNFRIVLRFP